MSIPSMPSPEVKGQQTTENVFTVKDNYGIDKSITNLRFVGRFFTLSH